MNYPNDDDGAVLKLLADHGVDMSAPMKLEFAVLCADETAALRIEKALQEAGYSAEASYNEGELEDDEEMTEENEEFWPSWSVIALITMVPEYSEIVRIQQELNRLSNLLGGKSDGWGATIDE